jgi:hypothetical protein
MAAGTAPRKIATMTVALRIVRIIIFLFHTFDDRIKVLSHGREMGALGARGQGASAAIAVLALP